MGYELLETENCAAAFDKYLAEKPRIIITDWMMPSMTGPELCRCVRSQPQETYTYIIMLTSMDGKENFLEGMDAGADDYLIKPLDEEHLQARLRVAGRILSLQREVRELQGLLPICAWCKKIRNDQSAWQQIESYIAGKTDVHFSHGICPDCAKNFGKSAQ